MANPAVAAFGAVRKAFQGLKGVGPGTAADLGQAVFTGTKVKNWKKHWPWVALGIPPAAEFVGYPVGRGVQRGLSDYSTEMMRAEGRFQQEERTRQVLTGARLEGMRRAMLESAAKLAALDPQLYNQVLAGRRLPQGAAVFGGRPRVDLLEELALDMASGAYTETNPQQELLDLLGG